jgi:hypothetical protein
MKSALTVTNASHWLVVGTRTLSKTGSRDGT